MRCIGGLNGPPSWIEDVGGADPDPATRLRGLMADPTPAVAGHLVADGVPIDRVVRLRARVRPRVCPSSAAANPTYPTYPTRRPFASPCRSSERRRGLILQWNDAGDASTSQVAPPPFVTIYTPR